MGRPARKATTPPTTPVKNKSNPQSLIRRFLLLTKDLRTKEGWTVEKATSQLANQIEFICDLDEYYPVNKEDDDDPRPDLVTTVLTSIGFVWTARTGSDRDRERAKWDTTGLTFEQWQGHVESLQELSEELRRDKYGNTPTTRRVSFADDSEDDGPEKPGGKGKRKRGEEAEGSAEAPTEGERPREGPTPADLAANAALLRAAKEAMMGGPADTDAGGASGNKPVNYDLPQSRSMASGLFFEEGSSGVPELKKRKKMSFDRWSEYNGHLCDGIVDVPARKAYRNYLALITRFYTNSSGSKWNSLLDADEEHREMIRTGELDGFDDRKIMERLLSNPALMSTGGGGGGGGGGRKGKGGNKDKGKGAFDKANTPCRFHKSPAGCKKGDNCDFKH